MELSFTQKKSIRKNFGRLKETLSIQNLIEVQKNSFNEFITKTAEKNKISIEDQINSNFSEIPLNRYGTIEEFGKVGAFLLSDASSYITGSSIAVDGGIIKTVW